MAPFSGTSIARLDPGRDDPGQRRTEREQAMKYVALQAGEYRRCEPGARRMSDEESGDRWSETDIASTPEDRTVPLRAKQRRLPPGMY